MIGLRLLAISVALTALLGTPTAFAQDVPAENGGAAENVNDICAQYPKTREELAAYAKACGSPTGPAGAKVSAPSVPIVFCGIAAPSTPELASEIEAACVEDTKRAFAYNEKMRDHNVRIYSAQADASESMRILVWVVVYAGIVMAIFQLIVIMQIELWRMKRKDSAGAPILGEQSLELGVGKVQITSSVTGVIVLALSIAFLYLYLTEVYPIKPPPS